MTNEYLAGLLDGEGTFQFQFKFSKTGFSTNARVQFGFKLLPEEELLIKEIQKYLDCGGIYISNAGKENAIIRFCTTKVDDTIKVCKLVLPCLHLKQKQCQQLLEIAELIKSKKALRYCKGFHTRSFDYYTKEEIIKMVTVGTTMNAGKQSGKYRDTMSRNTQYYIDKINEIYK